MSKFIQDFTNCHLKSQYKLVDCHIVEVGKIDLQELYNSMLPSSLDSILKAFLDPVDLDSVDSVAVDNSYQSFEDLIDNVNSYAEANNLNDLSFSEILNLMISPKMSDSKVNSNVESTVSGGDLHD